MLSCAPQSLCSWDFRVSSPEGEGSLTFEWLTEQGTILLAGRRYRVAKHGVASGHWTLESDTGVVAEARKVSALARAFDIRAGGMTLTAKAIPLSRQFRIECEGRAAGFISPMHPFTRRATVECSESVPVVVQMFIFWLAALMWKRANNSAAANA